jgi:cell division protein ZapA
MSEKAGIPPVTVRIGGEDHTIRANVEPEYTKKCAAWVDDRITEIRKQLGLIESHKAAILAALSITDEMFQARARVEDIQNSVAQRTESLLFQLEQATTDTSVD